MLEGRAQIGPHHEDGKREQERLRKHPCKTQIPSAPADLDLAQANVAPHALLDAPCVSQHAYVPSVTVKCRLVSASSRPESGQTASVSMDRGGTRISAQSSYFRYPRLLRPGSPPVRARSALRRHRQTERRPPCVGPVAGAPPLDPVKGGRAAPAAARTGG